MATRLDRLPRPYNGESKTVFSARYVKDPEVVRRYNTPAKRAIMAEKAWLRAKQDSLVSVKVTEGEFLLFGSLTVDWKGEE